MTMNMATEELKFELFYKRLGITNGSRLLNPKVIDLLTSPIPYDTVIHPLIIDSPNDPTSMDPPYNWFTPPYYISHVTRLSSLIGNPIELPLALPAIRGLTQALNARPLFTDIASTDKKRLHVVVNYSFLDTRYKYRKGLLADTHKLINRISTVVATIATTETTRQQILLLPINPVILNKTWLKMAASKDLMWLQRNTDSEEIVVILELYKYFIGEPSLFDPLRETKMVWLLHYQDKAILLHNAIMSAGLEDKSESDLSDGLTTDYPNMAVAKRDEFILRLYSRLIEHGDNGGVREGGDGTTASQDGVSEDEEEDAVVSTATPIGKSMTVSERREQVILSTPSRSKALPNAIDKAASRINPLTEQPLLDSDPVDTPVMIRSTITTLPPVIQSTMADLTAQRMDQQYVDQGVMQRDTAAAINGIARTGFVITDMQAAIVEDAVSRVQTIRVSVQPADGSPSTILITLPVPERDGTFVNDAISYRMRKQKTELPIRKVSSTRVVCSSYYGTLFIDRSTRAVNNQELTYVKAIRMGMMNPDMDIRAIPQNVFDKAFVSPPLYGKLAKYYQQVIIGDYRFMFDHTARTGLPGYAASLETNGGVVAGTLRNRAIVMWDDGSLTVDGKEVPTLMELLNIDPDKLPKELVTLKVLGKEVPMIVVLSRLIGLQACLDAFCQYKVVEKIDRSAHYNFVFSDAVIAVTSMLPYAPLLLNGLLKMRGLMKEYTRGEFNRPDIYQLWMEDNDLTIRHFREIDLLDKMFIDDIATYELLKGMGEPTEFKALMLRATELLRTEYHERVNDGKLIRVRGNERFSGIIYRELVDAVRIYQGQLNPNKRKLEMSPWQVLTAIQTDNSVKPIEETNPIQLTKEQDAITLGGAGGISSQTITSDHRKFDENDVGFISEAATDSGDVGMVTFLSAAASMGSIRGTNASQVEDAKDNPAATYSVSYMLAPGLDRDHMPRVAFTSIQNTHNINMSGSETPYVRTGYEYVLPYRLNKKFAWMAEDDGVVKSVSEHGIVVKYASGKEEGCQLGIVPGRAADKQYPHHVVAALKQGDAFRKEDALSYNTAFFALDDLYPTKLCYKPGKFINTAFVDDMYTYEDSCTLSKDIVPEVSTQTLKVKSIVITFDKDIDQVKGIGSVVAVDTPLMVIMDEITSGVLNQDAMDSLLSLTANAPMASTTGTIIDMEALYFGDLEDMRPNLRALIEALDARRAVKAKAANAPVFTGQVHNNHRINGAPMMPNMVEIKVYIQKTTGVVPADKYVFGNQLKATVSHVFPNAGLTTSGVQYHATFSYRANMARIVESNQLVGAYSRFMDFLGHYLANKL